jgi:protein-L-isoaspartate(D-aspartate) O-methyltransferase
LGISAEAEEALAAAGHGHVTVIAGDGEYGHAPNAPYDRITVTAGAWELPAAWADQLAPGGLLVVPLRMRGLTRSVTFERTAGTWRSRSMHECGFMPIRGAGAVAERNIPLGDTGVTIRIDDGQPADATALQHALSNGPVQVWTGIEVTVTGELDFWLAGLDGFFRLLAGTDAVMRSSLVPPAFTWGAMGRVEVHPLTHAPVPDALMQIEKRNSRVIVLTEG